jgi:hypothetical protein
MAASQVYHTDGQTHRLAILNGSQTKTTNVYIGLRICDGLSARPADANVADTLASNLSEVSATGTGYARIAVAWTAGTLTVSGSDAVLTFPSVIFNFTGGVANATHMFIATTPDNTGHLLYSVPLSAVRNFANGDSDTVTAKIQEGQHV